ncbi:MAG: hypothetical protein R8G33_02565 [Gammaproteobacteria bacterium]|nr:hypothetical protein [Gammaproteobacteria bacterium]
MFKYLVFISILLISISVRSTTLPQLEIKELYENAEVVAIIEITQGKQIEIEDKYLCASEYQSRVLEPLKGDVDKDSILKFGPYSGRKLGGVYLVFLSKKDSIYEPVASSNSVQMNAKQEHFKKCNKHIPELHEMFHGVSTLEVSWTTKFNNEEAVKFPEEFVTPPNGLEKKLVESGDNEINTVEYWVKAKEIVSYLRSLESS